jgi:hypothetical protein
MQGSNFISLPPPPAAPVPLWHVPVALGLWIVSMFLLYQGVAFLSWAIREEDKEAPNPKSGIILAWILTASLILFFYLNSDKKPDGFSLALLFSSLPIGAFAAFKFGIAFFFARSSPSSSPSRTRSPLWLLVLCIFNFLQFAGSVATLIAFFR